MYSQKIACKSYKRKERWFFLSPCIAIFCAKFYEWRMKKRELIYLTSWCWEKDFFTKIYECWKRRKWMHVSPFVENTYSWLWNEWCSLANSLSCKVNHEICLPWKATFKFSYPLSSHKLIFIETEARFNKPYSV